MRKALRIPRIPLACAVVLCLVVAAPDGAVQDPAAGRTVQAKDGDLILIDGVARVRLVRRREAQVQTVYSPAERWLIVMLDYAPAPGKRGDGGTDMNYTFHDVTEWPLGEQWHGAALVDEYSVAGEMPAYGIALTTQSQTVQVLDTQDRGLFRDPAAAAVVYRSMSRGGGGGRPFALEARRLAEQATRNAQMRAGLPGGGPETRSGIEMGIGVLTPAGSYPPPTAPVRVGGSIRPPRKIVDVAPVIPEQAKQAGISGLVLVEVIIGADGRITSAKVLRSIPMLDEAALDAVRQWRYEPTELNGVPVPVIMTVAVKIG